MREFASMFLSQIIQAITEHEKELTLVNCDSADSIAEDLESYFQSQNVRISTATTASGRPADVVVLSRREGVLSVTSSSTLRELLREVPTGDDSPGFADAKYEPILGHLKETTFTSYETEQMLAASREIEDRAYRVGTGTIHAGFQRLSLLDDQQTVYTELAERGVEVHAYGIPDIPPPDIDEGTVHTIETDEIAETWFVVFDGGDDESQKSALLAEERNEKSFYGVWTYDATIVDSILNHLEESYLSLDDTRQRSDV